MSVVFTRWLSMLPAEGVFLRLCLRRRRLCNASDICVQIPSVRPLLKGLKLVGGGGASHPRALAPGRSRRPGGCPRCSRFELRRTGSDGEQGLEGVAPVAQVGEAPVAAGALRRATHGEPRPLHRPSRRAARPSRRAARPSLSLSRGRPTAPCKQDPLCLSLGGRELGPGDWAHGPLRGREPGPGGWANPGPPRLSPS